MSRWTVPRGWTRGEDLEFRWVGQIAVLEPARFANNGPGNHAMVSHDLMRFHDPNECNAFALWWFDCQNGETVRTIWSRPAFQYRPQTGELIEGEVIPARKSAKRLTVRKTSYED